MRGPIVPLALAPTERVERSGTKDGKVKSSRFILLRSDLWSERSKTKDLLSFVTDATSLRGSL